MEWLVKPLLEIINNLPYGKLTGDQVFALTLVIIVIWGLAVLLYVIIYGISELITGSQALALLTILAGGTVFLILIHLYKDTFRALDVIILFAIYLLFSLAVILFTSATRQKYSRGRPF